MLHGGRWAAPWQAPNEFTVTSCVVIERFYLSKLRYFVSIAKYIEENYVLPPRPSLCFWRSSCIGTR